MKNLHKQNTKNILIIVLVIILIVLSVLVPSILDKSSIDFWQNNRTALSVLFMAVFMFASVFIFSRHFREFAVTRAMISNQKKLDTDRKSFPSNRQNFDLHILRNDFTNNNFKVTDESDGGFFATKSHPANIVVRVSDSDNAKQVTKDLVFSAQNASAGKLSMNVYIACFIGCDFDDKTIYDAKTIEAIPGGCILPVYYDTKLNRAYYMGGYTGRRSCESLAQKIIKEIILNHPQPFDPKTEKDITEDEEKFNELDIQKILYDISHPISEELKIANELNENEIKFSENDKLGCIYYKYKGKTISHTYKIIDNKYIISNLNTVYYCAPKAKPASNDSVLHFKSKLEQYLENNNINYSFDM